MRTRTRAQLLTKKLRNDLKFHVTKYEVVMIIIQRDRTDMRHSQNGV